MKHTAADMPGSWYSLPISSRVNALVGTFVPRTHGGYRFATVRADEPRLVDLRRPWRSERLVVSIDDDGFVLPSSFVWGEFASIGMADAQPVERYFSSGADRGSIIGNPLGESCGGRAVWLTLGRPGRPPLRLGRSQSVAIG